MAAKFQLPLAGQFMNVKPRALHIAKLALCIVSTRAPTAHAEPLLTRFRDNFIGREIDPILSSAPRRPTEFAVVRVNTSARITSSVEDCSRQYVGPECSAADADVALQAVRLRLQHPCIGEDASDELSVMARADFVPPDFRQNPPLAFRAIALSITGPVRHWPPVNIVSWLEPRVAVLFDKQPNRLNRLPGLGGFCAAAKFYPSLERPGRSLAGRASAPRYNSETRGEFAGSRYEAEPVRHTFDLAVTTRPGLSPSRIGE